MGDGVGDFHRGVSLRDRTGVICSHLTASRASSVHLLVHGCRSEPSSPRWRHRVAVDLPQAGEVRLPRARYSYQFAQLLHIGAAGRKDVAYIGAAGQVAHADLDQPALELEILAHAADPQRLAVAARGLGDGLERRLHPVMRVLAGDAHLGREVARPDMQRVDAVDRGDGVGVGDRLRGLDHRHQEGLLIDDLAHFGLRNRGVAELRAAAEGRAVALRRIEAGFDDRPGLGGVLDRHHNPLRAAIENARRVVRIVRGHPRDGGDAHAQRRDADPGRGLQRGRVVFEVDIDRIEPAGRRDHRDVRGAQLVDPHAQHQLVGLEFLLRQIFADLRGHGPSPQIYRRREHPALRRRAQRAPIGDWGGAWL